MKMKKLPVNIKLLLDTPANFDGLLPVKSLQLFEVGSKDFHPQGLYSNVIFAPQGDRKRTELEGYINFKVRIFHPLYYRELIKLKGLYKEVAEGKAYAIFNPETNDLERSDIMTGQTGYSFFMSVFDKLVFKRNDSTEREKRIDFLEKYRGDHTIARMIVLPAGLRDIEIREDGQPAEEEVNDLYRRLISVSNTITTSYGDEDSVALNDARASLQRTALELYNYYFQILDGKKGIHNGKYASRRILGSTRNVLSSQETGSNYLGDERQPGLNTTVCGLFQFVKGVEDYFVQYAINNKFLADFMENLYTGVNLVSQHTLESVKVDLNDKAKEAWGTTEGIESSLNQYGQPGMAHRPVMIQGHYLKLVYQDDKHFKILNSIKELPSNFSKKNVHPMTWTEFYYLHIHDFIKETRGFNTRYPVTGLGSIYVSEVYVKTTVKGHKLKQLDDNWEESDVEVLEFPDTVAAIPLFLTMSVSPFMLSPLGAD